MIDLKDRIEESLLDDKLVDKMDNDAILDGLFSGNKSLVKKVIDELKNTVIDSKAKQIKTFDKILFSDSFFIQFPAREKQTYDMLLLKGYGTNWYIVYVSINSKRIVDHDMNDWCYIEPYLSPEDALMYEVPAHMEDLCYDVMCKAMPKALKRK
jgi:hypothetical protein